MQPCYRSSRYFSLITSLFFTPLRFFEHARASRDTSEHLLRPSVWARSSPVGFLRSNGVSEGIKGVAGDLCRDGSQNSPRLIGRPNDAAGRWCDTRSGHLKPPGTLVVAMAAWIAARLLTPSPKQRTKRLSLCRCGNTSSIRPQGSATRYRKHCTVPCLQCAYS